MDCVISCLFWICCVNEILLNRSGPYHDKEDGEQFSIRNNVFILRPPSDKKKEKQKINFRLIKFSSHFFSTITTTRSFGFRFCSCSFWCSSFAPCWRCMNIIHWLLRYFGWLIFLGGCKHDDILLRKIENRDNQSDNGYLRWRLSAHRFNWTAFLWKHHFAIFKVHERSRYGKSLTPKNKNKKEKQSSWNRANLTVIDVCDWVN